MDDTELRLDGNAAAGLLEEVFVREPTAARAACASCGATGPLGAQHLYAGAHAPGTVVRCSRCEAVLIVLVRAGGRTRIGLRGTSWIEFEDAG